MGQDAKAVLIETIVEELLRSRSTSTKVIDQAKKVLRRVDWMKLARKMGGFMPKKSENKASFFNRVGI